MRASRPAASIVDVKFALWSSRIVRHKMLAFDVFYRVLKAFEGVFEVLFACFRGDAHRVSRRVSQ